MSGRKEQVPVRMWAAGALCQPSATVLLWRAGHWARLMLSSRLVAGSLRKNLQPPFHVSGLPGCSPAGKTLVARRDGSVQNAVCPLGTAQMGDAQVGRKTLGSQTPVFGAQKVARALARSGCVCGPPCLRMLAHAVDRPRLLLPQGPSYMANP